MSRDSVPGSVAREDELKELRHIKNLLILGLIKQGATSEEIDLAVHMGSSNIRAMFPMRKIKKNS